MSTFRLKYPPDADARAAILSKARESLANHGALEGSTEEGTIRVALPLGEISGSYRSELGAEFIEFHVHRKPWIIPLSMIQTTLAKVLTT